MKQLYLKPGVFGYRNPSQTINNSEVNMKQWLSRMLTNLGVRNMDPCCPFIPVVIAATGTATAVQVESGLISTTSAAATTITMPTGTLLGNQVNAVKGTSLDLFIDNTDGSNPVTMAVAVNGILSDAAVGSSASFGDLTIASGVTGMARYTIMFSSPTAYVFTRTA